MTAAGSGDPQAIDTNRPQWEAKLDRALTLAITFTLGMGAGVWLLWLLGGSRG